MCTTTLWSEDRTLHLAGLIVKHVEDLRGREAHFNCHAVTVRLHTTDYEVVDALWRMTSNMRKGALSVMVVLGEEVVELRNEFMCVWRVAVIADPPQRRLPDV